MPLLDLVEYFNQRISAEQGLSQPPLFLREGRVEGRFAGIRLATVFQPLRRADEWTAIAGHIAELHARREDGGDALPAELFDHTEAGRIVGLDRLCRTIHMLNYLPGAHHGGCLFLDVHPRHVLGVKGNHGAYFEDVIFRCGLEPERVVITLALSASYRDQLPRLLGGLANYRLHGYATALGFEGAAGAAALVRRWDELHTRFAPDFLRLPAAAELPPGSEGLALAELLHPFGARLVVEGIAAEAQLQAARAMGADWVAGELIEASSRGERRRA